MNNPIVANLTTPNGAILHEITAKEACYMKVLLGRNEKVYTHHDEHGDKVRQDFQAEWPGGLEGLAEDKGGDNCALYGAMKNLTSPLFRNPPWRTPQPPKEIDGHEVTYSKKGIRVGCQELTLEQMELMVKECKSR